MMLELHQRNGCATQEDLRRHAFSEVNLAPYGEAAAQRAQGLHVAEPGSERRESAETIQPHQRGIGYPLLATPQWPPPGRGAACPTARAAAGRRPAHFKKEMALTKKSTSRRRPRCSARVPRTAAGSSPTAG